MKKSDIQFHFERSTRVPAINVKVRNFALSASDCAAHFNCDRDTAERALQFAFDSACEEFWSEAESTAREIFGEHVKVYSQGRSGGWLTVERLSDVESWDAIALAKWRKLDKWCAAEIAHLTAREQFIDNIASNEWAKTGAERYNFIDTADGTKCIADLKAEARAAGFGAVVRGNQS